MIYFIFPNIAILDKYDFEIFENAEATMKIFDIEMKITSLVDKLSKHIAYRMRFIIGVMKNLIISRTFSSNHVVRLFKTQSRACNVRLYMRSQLNKKEIDELHYYSCGIGFHPKYN